MIKSTPFELFGKGETLYFDIARLYELEQITGKPVQELLFKTELKIGFCVKALTVGLRHHYPKGNEGFWLKKVGEYLESGGSLLDVQIPLSKAALASGVFGAVKDDEAADEKNVPEETD